MVRTEGMSRIIPVPFDRAAALQGTAPLRRRAAMTLYSSAPAIRTNPPGRTLLARGLALACGLATSAAPGFVFAGVGTFASPPMPAGGGSIVVMNCDDDGTGSLREAVRDLAVSGDTIDLRFLPCSTITLATGVIATGLDNLAFAGPGRTRLTISGGGQFPVFAHVGAGTLRISGMTVEDGYKYSAIDDAPGGCIYSQGHVALERVHVHDCVARTTGQHAARGGGIHVAGDLVLVDSIVSGNDALADDAEAFGGGFFAGGDLRSKYSLFSGNDAGGNHGSFGAGVALGDAFVTGSSVFGNDADSVGGLALLGTHATTPLIVRNSTVGFNASRGPSATAGLLAGTTASLSNSTIAFNVFAGDPATLPGAAAGAYLSTDSQLVSTIVGSNFGVVDQKPIASDLGGIDAEVTGDHSLVMASLLPLPPDTLRVDPGLAPAFVITPTSHGFTVVIPFADATSPALDAGSNPFALDHDQRGAPYRRVEGAAPDIGATESDADRIFYDGFDWSGVQSEPAIALMLQLP